MSQPITETLLDQYLPEWNGAPKLITGQLLGNMVSAEISVESDFAVTPDGSHQATQALTQITGGNPGDSFLLPLAIPGTQINVYITTLATFVANCQPSNPNNGGLPDIIWPLLATIPSTSSDVNGAIIQSFYCPKIGVWFTNF